MTSHGLIVRKTVCALFVQISMLTCYLCAYMCVCGCVCAEELHAEVCYAECLLHRAALTFLQVSQLELVTLLTDLSVELDSSFFGHLSDVC